MKLLRQQTLNNQLKSCETIICNGKKVTEIKLLMARRGYDTAEMNLGQGLHATASTAAQAAREATGDAADGAQAAQEAEAAVRAVYQGLAKTARTVFRRDRPSRVLLGLVGPEPRRQADFEQAARTLFNTTAYTPLITSKLAEHEYDGARLSLERSLIDEWVTQRNFFTELSGASEDATAAQTVAMTALIDWASEYIRHARIVMAKRPGLLEKLGIKVRNQPTKAQREGRAKAAATRRQKREAVKKAA